ncbi:MAG: GtrA family protein [Butyrivibrio sp.]|nr:GtrA family protein [Acetatifactor muris]MCM1560271.1 GtrA family protein [Butyrivibrio sp.]
MLKKILENEKLKPYIQFVKFGLVGASNTLVFYLLYAGILFLLRGLAWKQDYILANVTAFTISIFWSFYWNNKYVFKKTENGRRNIWKALGKCFLSYGFTGYILENVLSFIWIEGMGISKYISPLLNMIFTVPANFFLNKLWAFRDKN